MCLSASDKLIIGTICIALELIVCGFLFVFNMVLPEPETFPRFVVGTGAIISGSTCLATAFIIRSQDVDIEEIDVSGRTLSV